ncbi:hypothetical protein CFII64_11184 [Pseudomonas sp. CFII64]|uniref:hypothetical protein n=1 Tax=Pseudomonas sp. CFII64 TaxID=911242 RepID=UPI000357FA2A|nr:hypothetical protein [Pseudomonas sp. CFII64]EPJ85678.1 hypothetical protein CFII64_11184 [Pseudomonas sp. CFII64]
MSLTWLQSRRTSAALTLAVFLALGAVQLWYQSRDVEIALKIGEPWEDMRQRSSANIDPAIAGINWGRQTDSDARLRFMDIQYGFVTPQARFFTISFDAKGMVGNVRMSPQIEPLLLDDTLKIVLDLQEQWRNAGWHPILTGTFPSFADTPQWRARLRDVNKGGTAYWPAGDKYQVMLVANRFRDDKRPTEERYLITLELAHAWRKP